MQEMVEVYFIEIEPKETLEKFVTQITQTCFEKERLMDLNFSLSITLTTPEKIQELNKTYRQVDKETDVLSFPMFEKEELEQIIKEKRKNPTLEVLGDIMISIEQVKKQAIEYGHTFERELAYMLVHGFYHLMGYDHMEEEEKNVMRQKEEAILTKLNQTK